MFSSVLRHKIATKEMRSLKGPKHEKKKENRQASQTYGPTFLLEVLKQ